MTLVPATPLPRASATLSSSSRRACWSVLAAGLGRPKEGCSFGCFLAAGDSSDTGCLLHKPLDGVRERSDFSSPCALRLALGDALAGADGFCDGGTPRDGCGDRDAHPLYCLRGRGSELGIAGAVDDDGGAQLVADALHFAHELDGLGERPDVWARWRAWHEN